MYGDENPRVRLLNQKDLEADEVNRHLEQLTTATREWIIVYKVRFLLQYPRSQSHKQIGID